MVSKGIKSKMDMLRAEIYRKQSKMVGHCEDENNKTAIDKFNINLQQLLNNFKIEEFMRN